MNFIQDAGSMIFLSSGKCKETKAIKQPDRMIDLWVGDYYTTMLSHSLSLIELFFSLFDLYDWAWLQTVCGAGETVLQHLFFLAVGCKQRAKSAFRTHGLFFLFGIFDL